MEDDFDLRTLPANFVSVSRPSGIIEKLTEKRRRAHNEAVEEMNFKKKEVNVQIENQIRNESNALKAKLEKIKSDVEDSLFILVHKNEDEINLEENPLRAANKEIVQANDVRRKAVDIFYNKLVCLDKERTQQFKLILNDTFSKLVNISYELPFTLDEFFENQIVSINQFTVNNFQSYAELQSELQLQIENDTRVWLQMLSGVKERVKKYHEGLARDIMSKSRHNLNQSLTELLNEGQLAKEIENFDGLQTELESSLEQTKTIPVVLEDVEEMLANTRTVLAGLDQSAKNIVAIYKSTIVIIFNRFFEELDNIKQFLINNGLVDGNDIEDFQKEFYTPGVEELNLQYQAEFEELKGVWNETISFMRNCVEETFTFLKDSAYLFDLHFQRMEDARTLIKRDVKNLAQKNNMIAEISEGQLNIIIDRLRQGSTKAKLENSLVEVKKALDSIKKLYNSQSLTEIKVVQKFKYIINTEIDVLMSELMRFLTLCPPDEDLDPKIQRRRASQISIFSMDPTEELIPVQMLFCKFQVEAVKNWQFGLWEAINNYVQVGRAEILEKAEEWMKDQYAKINDRLNIKLAFHKPRYERVICSVYEKRLHELERHVERFGSHKKAVEAEIRKLKEMQKLSEISYNNIYKSFIDETKKIMEKLLNTKHSGQVRRNDIILKKNMQDVLNSTDTILSENINLANKLMEDIKYANMKFAKAVKFFSEGGNYTIDEVKSWLKDLKRLETYVDTNMTTIYKENEKIHLKFREKLDKENVEISACVLKLIQEHEHNEKTVNKISKLQEDIRSEVINLKKDMNSMQKIFNNLTETSSEKLGDHEYMEIFFYQLKENESKIIEQAYFLLHPDPVIMYSTAKSEPRESAASIKRSFKDFAALLFGVTPKEKNECFISRLNNYLNDSLQIIQLRAQEFYSKNDKHMLDPSKLQPTYNEFMEEVLNKFKKYLIQCEICWLENVLEFVLFLNEFLLFKEEYLINFEDKFCSISHDYCRRVKKDIKKQLQDEREEIKNKLHAVHNKLKALHGHPNNRHLLSNIYQEFEELEKQIEEKLKTISESYKNNVTEKYETVKNNFHKTNSMSRELNRDVTISQLNTKLNEQLSIKLSFVKVMIGCELSSGISSEDNLIMSISKQVINYMDNVLPLKSLKPGASMVLSAEDSYVESASYDFLNGLEVDLKMHIQNIEAFVENELVKYFEQFQEIWPNEVSTICGLYEIQYDKGKVIRD